MGLHIQRKEGMDQPEEGMGTVMDAPSAMELAALTKEPFITSGKVS